MEKKEIYLRELKQEDANELLDLEVENIGFANEFAILKEAGFYTLEHQQSRISKMQLSRKCDIEYAYGIFRSEDNVLMGTLNLFGIVRGPIQGAWLGYFLGEKYNGKGYTTCAVKEVIQIAFQQLHLHRIEAGAMPENMRSLRVLEKCGFIKEGLSKKNVLVNGSWEDHFLFALINPLDES